MNAIIHLDRLITRSLSPPAGPSSSSSSFAIDSRLVAFSASSTPAASVPVASGSSSRSVPPSPVGRTDDLPPVPLRRRATSGAPPSLRPPTTPASSDADDDNDHADGGDASRRRLAKRRRPSSAAVAGERRWLPARIASRLWAILVALALWFSSGKRGMRAFGTGMGRNGARGRSTTVSSAAGRRAAAAAATAVGGGASRPGVKRRGETDSSAEADGPSLTTTAAAAAAAMVRSHLLVDDDDRAASTGPPTPADADDGREVPFPDPRTQALDPRTQALDPAVVALRSAAADIVVGLRPSLPTPNPTFALLPPPPPAASSDSGASDEEAVIPAPAVIVAPRSRLLHNPLGQTTLLRPTARPSSSSLSPPGSFDGSNPSSLLASPTAGAAVRKTTPFHKPKTLILDLDETLIHSTSRPMAATGPGGAAAGGFGRWGRGASGGRGRGEGHMVEVFLGGRSTVYHVYKRPYVDYFLKKVSSWYTLVIFTASMQEYADPVIDWLDGGRGMFAKRLFRDSCVQHANGAYMKDLAVMGEDLESVALIDNSPISYALNQANGIPIDGWFSDPNDQALLDLLPVLDSLRFTGDVRHVLGLRGF